MGPILCPIDFSPGSLNAANYASGLAHSLKAKLIIVHVFEPTLSIPEMALPDLTDTETLLLESVEKKIKAIEQKLKKQFTGLRSETVILRGIAPDELISMVRKQTPELVILGATGTSKLMRLMMGSNTSRIIREVNCPVLSVPKQATFKGIHKIVFATDLHDDNIRSAMMISEFAKIFDAEIAFLFVDDKHVLHSDDWVEEMTGKIRRRVKYPKLSGYVVKNPSVIKGIDFFTKKFSADLLVMFTHPKHFPESLYHSSLTQMTSHQSQVPLLALKKEDIPLNVKK